MTDKKYPSLIVDYQNDLELIELLLQIYAIGRRSPIRQFEMTVMKYYIKYGFNEEAVSYIKEDEKKTDVDIRVANTHLRSKGYLELGKNNLRKSTLSQDMQNLRNSFILDEHKSAIYVLGFKYSQ